VPSPTKIAIKSLIGLPGVAAAVRIGAPAVVALAAGLIERTAVVAGGS
jgi:hypothetical protein